jgi:AraC-like DNA-binding protein
MLADERDRQAVELLRTGELSLKEISGALHYSQPSAFARAFKQRHGVSPREFRARPFEAPRSGWRAKGTAARIAPAARPVEKSPPFARPSRLVGGKTDSQARLVSRAQA